MLDPHGLHLFGRRPSSGQSPHGGPDGEIAAWRATQNKTANSYVIEIAL
jgi:hypothetical protein